jgi:hypothetical protein
MKQTVRREYRIIECNTLFFVEVRDVTIKKTLFWDKTVYGEWEEVCWDTALKKYRRCGTELGRKWGNHGLPDMDQAKKRIDVYEKQYASSDVVWEG